MRYLLPALLLVLVSRGAFGAASAPLVFDIPATGLTRVSFTGMDGEVRIGSSPDDAVHVKLELQQQKAAFLWVFRWESETTARDMAAARLAAGIQGDTLNLFLSYPSGARHDDVQEHWTIQVPARFAVDAVLADGRLVIRDVAGGVSAQLNAGDLTIRIPGGPLKASVSTGRVHVISDTTQPGKITVRSNFGLAALSFNGKLYAPPPSSFHFIGNTEQRQESGKDNMEVKVFAGEADLRVGPVGDDTGYRGLFDDNDK